MMLLLFAVFAITLVGCSLMVILHRNPVTSALFLVVAFCALAGLYLLLQAEFLAMVQVIVYAGAIMVLFLFVIMYLNLKRDVEDGLQFALRRGAGWLLGILLLGTAALFLSRGWAPGATTEASPPPIGNSAAIGRLLYSRYLFPFELTSILLLVGIVGAVVIGRGRAKPPGSEEPVP